jgi:hypothetical protein
MTAQDHDSILNAATPQEAAYLLTTLESGQHAAYETAHKAEATPACGPAISTAAEIHRLSAEAINESRQPGMHEPGEPLDNFAARARRESSRVPELETEAG